MYFCRFAYICMPVCTRNMHITLIMSRSTLKNTSNECNVMIYLSTNIVYIGKVYTANEWQGVCFVKEHVFKITTIHC